MSHSRSPRSSGGNNGGATGLSLVDSIRQATRQRKRGQRPYPERDVTGYVRDRKTLPSQPTSSEADHKVPISAILGPYYAVAATIQELKSKNARRSYQQEFQSHGNSTASECTTKRSTLDLGESSTRPRVDLDTKSPCYSDSETSHSDTTTTSTSPGHASSHYSRVDDNILIPRLPDVQCTMNEYMQASNTLENQEALADYSYADKPSSFSPIDPIDLYEATSGTSELMGETLELGFGWDGDMWTQDLTEYGSAEQ
ncbi:hypothetical protein BDZ97DRAFT_1920975 [Flammula alnicola]|nr:hypothetical protein BDZ97DRAFT_1920975 [Flammula alnicola]